MSDENEVKVLVQNLCEKLYEGGSLSQDEASSLLSAMEHPLADHEIVYAMGALARSNIEGVEDIIVSHLEQLPSSKIAAYALRFLCDMGLQQKYRRQIMDALNYIPPARKYPFSGGIAVGCMGKYLRSHKDKEFASIISDLLHISKDFSSSNRRESALAIAAQLAAVNAIGGDPGRAVDDKVYTADCVARFLTERTLG